MKMIIVGKAASGKDHLKQRLKNRGFKCAISCTTRPPRSGEIEGEDYYFISEDQFKQMIEQDLFLEWVIFNDWYYGTLKDEFDACDCMIMSPYGLSKIDPSKLNSAVVVYIDVDLEVRKQRLNDRWDQNDSVHRRIMEDERQFKDFDTYDLRITNPDF